MAALALLWWSSSARCQSTPVRPESRYKADVLLVVAHPDDDTMIGGYLAKLALDEHKQVAVIFATNGDAGGNNFGQESGQSLALERQLEARQALKTIGIENVWFLGLLDTPSQNVLDSLNHWNHGLALDQIVRIVRLTRPEVILTWLPAPVAGENHADHQASGVLATEAFDTAADPLQFPEQVSVPRDLLGLLNLTEGLRPWQPKKLYFFTDAFEVFSPYWHDARVTPTFRKNIGEGSGPVYDMTSLSPSQKVSYAELNARQQACYLTQEGELGVKALRSGDFKEFAHPEHLIFGKSVVKADALGDVFQGIGSSPLSRARALGPLADEEHGVSFEIGDPWHFASLFLRAHGMERISRLMPEVELAAGYGEKVGFRFNVCNHSTKAVTVTVESKLPVGWKEGQAMQPMALSAGECNVVRTVVVPPASGEIGWNQLQWAALADGEKAGEITARVLFGVSGGVPQ